MSKLFSPLQNRVAQLRAFSQAISTASTTREREDCLRQGGQDFALILKRNHNKLVITARVIKRPFGHIEVIINMADNWRKEFASIPLTEKDKEPLQIFREEMEQNPLEALETLMGVGYKVSIIWSDQSTSFIVSVIGTDATKFNSKKVLSSFSDDLEEGLFMAAYKVFRVAPDQEWPSQQEQSRWG